MLSRTASQLYWMSRYLERAENLVRMLDVTHSLSLLPQSRGAATELAAPLAVTGTLEAYQARHARLSAEQLFRFMGVELDNPASVVSCIRQARENAHAVRGQITAEMWEAINASWLEARELARHGVTDPSSFFDWVKERSHLFRGATYGTLQRNDAYWFIRLGTFVERADNTLRMLDARYQVLGEEEAEAISDASARGFYQWSALLRALSAFEAYTELYRDALNVRNGAELLLLQEDLPRSLLACVIELHRVLASLPGENGREAKRLAAGLEARLRYTSIDEVLEEGLHAWIGDFIVHVRQLGSAINTAYLETV